MRRSRRALALVVLLAAAASCTRSPERVAEDRAEIERLLAAYASAMAEAYRAGDTGPLAELAAPREVERVSRRIAELAEEGRGLRPSLDRQVVETIEFSSATTGTATTLETWDLRIVALGTELPVAESLDQENRLVYSLTRDRGRWWILARLLRSSTESP